MKRTNNTQKRCLFFLFIQVFILEVTFDLNVVFSMH